MNDKKNLDNGHNLYTFEHPLNYNNFSNTFFTVSDNIKSDLDLYSGQKEEKIKLYDVLLNNINDIKKSENGFIQQKTKSQQRVYDTLTNIVFKDNTYIDANKELIKITGENLDEKLLEKTIQQQEIIEATIFSKELNSTFYETYNYIDYKPIDFVNRSSKIMGFLNVYTLSSPLISLLMPIIILLIPFFTMRIRGMNISFSNYYTFLKQILSKIPAFRFFTFSSNDNISSKISGLFAFILYFVQVYYNTKYCKRYVDKNHDIHNTILLIKNVVNNSIQIISNIDSKLNDVNLKETILSPVRVRTQYYLNLLQDLEIKLQNYEKGYSVLSLNHVNNVGDKLKLFYEFVSNYKNIQDELIKIFDFNSFLYYYKNIHTNIKNKYINVCVNKDDKSHDNNGGNAIQNMYFPMLLLDNKKIVYNSVDLSKSYIISGPNASGKTTVLKSILFNILCSQQFGCGFYKNYILKQPYFVIESYINIIDTHDRNSLFQNESIRMMNIIEKIKKCDERMFFVFDELFSGTNPKEATACGISCLEHILQYNNVNFCLTTHYDRICKYFNDNRFKNIIQNKQMYCYYKDKNKSKEQAKEKLKVQKKQEQIFNNDISYKYTIKNGISKIHGGLIVLNNLKFHPSIINKTREILLEKRTKI
jgi:hypothetical protein